MSSPSDEVGEGRPDEAPFERGVLRYVRDPGLWPVWLVLVGHLAAGIGLVLLGALRDGRTGSRVTLALLVLASLGLAVWEARRHGRPGPLAVQLVVTWLAGAGLAWLADHYSLM